MSKEADHGEFFVSSDGIAIAVGLLASIDDLRRRQIAHWIPFLAFSAGLSWHYYFFGWLGLFKALEGAVAGFLVFLVFYLLGGMGGGDVKLMTGFGALLGPLKLLEASLWIAGVGGIIALSVVIIASTKNWLRGRKALEEMPLATAYAPAIAIGVWITISLDLIDQIQKNS